MKPEALKEVARIAAKLKPLAHTIPTAVEPGGPICPEWVFPLGVKLNKLLEAALRFHIPIGCWPVGAPGHETAVRVVMGLAVSVTAH